ncbi:hypothetical protein [Vibrio diabolicus]|uniref:hypothetical protein n=1 Tax=Vibrio diabolicus TaxID=50719 RepID=UPI0038CD434B
MEHKAYEFDWYEFQYELKPLMLEALSSNQTAIILHFIGENKSVITDPYEGEALPENWIDELTNESVQTLLDFALTKYYSLADDLGLDSDWANLSDCLNNEQSMALLGESINNFDPGCYGSYFQSSSMLEESINVLSSLKDPQISGFVERLRTLRKGLYVTF